MSDRRGSAASRGYNARWRKARITFLGAHPLCVRCLEADRLVPATVVDHRIPHRGDQILFWDTSNWDAICASCHNGDKQREEKSGVVQYRGSDKTGAPLDPKHHWNQ